MDERDLEALIEQYRAGLDAEIGLLTRLEQLSLQQQEASGASDLERLGHVADVRDRLTTALVAVEEQLRDVRQRLVVHRESARDIPGYTDAVARHREAIDLVTRIVETDQASLQSLTAAELARRDTARALERGETTLAAYRKVVAPMPAATLVDRRG